MTPSDDIFKQLNFLTEPELREEMLRHCHLLTFEKGEVIVGEGEFVKVVPIVIAGALRIFHTREEREILLYYVEPGETCMMSLSAGFFNTRNPSQAIATERTEVLAVPTPFITQWQKQYKSWNHFVIRTFIEKYDELLNVFESVAFDHIDKRALEYLQHRAAKQNKKEIEISHQELANELGTTRVVISRILKQFEIDKIVDLQRGSIKVL